MTQKTQCPCGSQQSYTQCCEPIIRQRSAGSAEALMRSRYTAFALGLAEYLLDTHHADFREADELKSLKHGMGKTDWCSLRVLSTRKGTKNDNDGQVEFVAFSHENNKPQQLHERSNFIKQNGQWYYTNGEQLPPIKIGRNDTCWCGSGKKFKKCCEKI